MGVKAAGADGATETTSADAVTPNPDPSPIKGEGGDVAAGKFVRFARRVWRIRHDAVLAIRENIVGL